MHEDFIGKALKCVWRIHISPPSIILVSKIQDSEEQEQQWGVCSLIGYRTDLGRGKCLYGCLFSSRASNLKLLYKGIQPISS